MLFPSPDVSRDDAGVVFHHLPDTSYDRGKSRVNAGEARAVAEAVRRHALETPERSLGVATFSLAQATAIENEVDRLAREAPALDAFLQNGRTEPFFVKNLETVQGDERDVVFISVGYGRGRDGRLKYAFGPLNQVGGERRLNVILTRARIRSEMFANFTDDDLDPTRCTSRGLSALRAYIAFARSGTLTLPEVAERDDESPFEDAVAQALSARGHHVRRQIGQAGYFIDIGVADPKRPGRMVLGVECDGAAYHASRAARDRDRLRQSVLEGLGWRVHRVWSTDWYRDPRGSLKRIEAAIAEALAANESIEVDVPKRPEAGTPAAITDVAAVEDGSSNGGDCIDRGSRRAVAIESLSAPEYVMARLPSFPYEGASFTSAPTRMVAEWLKRVAELEGPVHTDDAYRRVVAAAGISRVGKRIRVRMDEAVRLGVSSREFGLVDECLVSKGFDASKVRPRDRSALAARDRSFARVPAVELDAAITSVVAAGHGVPRHEVPQAVTRLLGFGRATEDVQAAIKNRVSRLLARSSLSENGARVLVVQR